jgi:ParB/RepB/Spo0J family partition protein
MKKELLTLKLEEINLNPEQPRKHFDEGKITILADSIKEVGLNTPISVRYDEKTNKVILIDGERRLRALKQAGIDELKYGRDYIVKEFDNDNAEFSGLIANCMREDLQPCEKGRAFLMILERRGIAKIDVAINVVNRAKDFIDNNFLSEPSARNYFIPKETIKQVAKDMKMVGVSGTNAVELLKILELPKDIQNKVIFAPPNSKIYKEKIKMNRHGNMVERIGNDRGEFIPISFAREFARIGNEKIIRFFLQKALNYNWTGKKMTLMVNDFLESKLSAEQYIINYMDRSRSNLAGKSEEQALSSVTASIDNMTSTLTSFRIINLVAMSDCFRQKMFAISSKGLLHSTINLKKALEELLLTTAEISRVKESERKIMNIPFKVTLTTPPKQRNGFRFTIPVELANKLNAEIGDTLEIQINAVIKPIEE